MQPFNFCERECASKVVPIMQKAKLFACLASRSDARRADDLAELAQLNCRASRVARASADRALRCGELVNLKILHFRFCVYAHEIPFNFLIRRKIGEKFATAFAVFSLTSK